MKFLCDFMLSRLGRWLRILGYDTKIATGKDDDKLLEELAELEGRVLLTKDKNVKGFLIRSDELLDQLVEVFSRFGLEPGFPEKSRCSVCNGELERILDKWRCKQCGKVYWEGSHWLRIKETVELLKKKLGLRN